MTIGNQAIVHRKKWQNQGDIDKTQMMSIAKSKGQKKLQGEVNLSGLEIQMGFFGPISNARSKKEKNAR